MLIIKWLLGAIAGIAITFVGIPLLMFSDASEWRAQFGGGSLHAIAKTLTPENADRAASLSKDDRKVLIAQCFSDFRKQRNPNASEARNVEIRKDLEDYADTACECMINGLEDRLTTYEFALAMTTGFTVGKNLDPGHIGLGDGKTRSLESLASKLGLNEQTMRKSSLTTLNTTVDLMKRCRRKG